MVIVQAGSGPKGQTGRSTVSMGGKGEGKEWREVGMRKTCAGTGGRKGANFEGTALEWIFRTRWSVCDITETGKSPSLSLFTPHSVALSSPFPRAGMQT